MMDSTMYTDDDEAVISSVARCQPATVFRPVLALTAWWLSQNDSAMYMYTPTTTMPAASSIQRRLVWGLSASWNSERLRQLPTGSATIARMGAVMNSICSRLPSHQPCHKANASPEAMWLVWIQIKAPLALNTLLKKASRPKNSSESMLRKFSGIDSAR